MNYLGSSKIIDFKDSKIDELYDRLNSDSIESFLKNTFNYIRDEVKFEFCQFTDSISDTAKREKGHCYHKANLFVGLMRKKGIRAGLKFQTLTIDAISPILSDELIPMLSSRPIGHFLAAVCLSGKWIRVDTIFDREILRYMNRLDWELAKDWDGKSEVLFPTKYVVQEAEVITEFAFDDDKIPVNPMIEKMNIRLKSIREDS